MIKGFLINIQFFTSIPIRKQLPMQGPYLKKAVQTFPLLGLFQGVLYAAILFCLQTYTPFSDLAAAFIVWLLTIVITGGLHLDGWMDTSDAFFSYQDREKRLEIMKDPRTGAFGVLSVIVLLSSRFLFIYEIVLNIVPSSYVLISIIPFLGKSVMGYLLLTTRPAREEGLAYFFQSAVSRKVIWIYPLYFIAAVFLLFIWNTESLLFAGVLGGVVVLTIFYIRKKIITLFGGVTGDVLGASVEGTELLLWMTVWLLHYFAMG
jgi:adenosylcobinamide-GDP ribazoletransferase